MVASTAARGSAAFRADAISAAKVLSPFGGPVRDDSQGLPDELVEPIRDGAHRSAVGARTRFIADHVGAAALHPVAGTEYGATVVADGGDRRHARHPMHSSAGGAA